MTSQEIEQSTVTEGLYPEMSVLSRIVQLTNEDRGVASIKQPWRPDGWQVLRCDAVAEINPENLGVTTLPDFTFRYIDISSVTTGVIHWDLTLNLQFRDAPSRARRLIRPGDVLLCTVRPGLRAHALADWPGDAPNTVGSTGFAILRAHANTDPHFLFHQILGDSVSHQIRAIEQGSNYPAINESDVKTLVLLVPPFPEQQQIAQILDTLDAAIRQTEAVIAKLRRVKVGLLHDLLTRGLDENGELRDPRQNPEQFEDSAVGRIPKSWQVRTIEGSASPEPGSTVIGPFGSNLKAEDYRDEGWPVVFVRDLSGNGFNWKSNVYVDQVKARQLAAHWVRPGDVVATKMGEPPGISAVYPDYMPPGVVTADVLRVRPASDVQPGWLSQFINSPAVTCQIRAITAGVTRPKITLKDFRSLLVALPGKREQCQIMERVNAIEAKFSGEEATLSILKMLKLGLTEDLLTGRIRVPVADELSL